MAAQFHLAQQKSYGGTREILRRPVSLRHANLLSFVEGVLHLYIERRGLGILHRETVAVRLGSRNVFPPDLLFLTKAQARQVGEAYVGVALALVVEALSPTTAKNDIGPKFFDSTGRPSKQGLFPPTFEPACPTTTTRAG